MVSVWLFTAAIVAFGMAAGLFAWLYYRERRRTRPTDDEDFAIGAEEDVILIRLDARHLPTKAQGKGLIPAETMAACYVVAYNVGMQLAADVSRVAGWDFPHADSDAAAAD